jgi:opacity protein-like surface antigen
VVRIHRKAFVSVGIALVVVAAPPVARPGAAQQKRGALFAIAGGYFGTDLYVGANVRNKVHLGDSWTYGARLVMMPQERYGVELSYMHASSAVSTSSDTVSFGQGTDKGTIGVDQIDLSGLWTGYRARTTGFVSLGIGTTIFTPHIPGATTSAGNGDAHWRFAFNAGLGAIFRLTETLSGRIDGRYRGVTTNHATGSTSYCDVWGYCYGYASTIYWNGEVTAGLGYTF